MKAKKLLPALLAITFLASCSSIDPSEVLADAIAAVDSLNEVTTSKYSLQVTGHISSFDTFEEPSSSYSVPSGVPGSTGNSYILRSPIILNSDSFYPENPDDEDINTADYSYYKITSRLLWTYDKVTQLQFEKQDDNLIFFVKGLSKRVIFYHVLTDPSYEIYSDVSMYARYNITLTYNNEGLLTEEKIETQNPTSSDKEMTVDVTTTYTYFN